MTEAAKVQRLREAIEHALGAMSAASWEPARKIAFIKLKSALEETK